MLHYHSWFVTLFFTEKNRSPWKRTTLLPNIQFYLYKYSNSLLSGCNKCFSASQASPRLYSVSHALSAFQGPCFFVCPLFLLCHQFHPLFVISISIPSLLFILQKMSSLSMASKSYCPIFVLSRPFLRIVSPGCF